MANFEYSDPKEPPFWQNGNHGPGLWKLIVPTLMSIQHTESH